MKTNRSQSSDGHGRTGFTLIELRVVIPIATVGGNPNVVWLRTSAK
jgi:hypothetical protein